MKWETENTLINIKKAQQKDKNALENLIQENAPLVKSIIKHYLNRGAEYDDLFQVGNLGLIKAVYGFCPDFNVRFSTYAVPMIIGEIRRFLRDNSSVRVTRSMRDLAYKALQSREKYNRESARKAANDAWEREKYNEESARKEKENIKYFSKTLAHIKKSL